VSSADRLKRKIDRTADDSGGRAPYVRTVTDFTQEARMSIQLTSRAVALAGTGFAVASVAADLIVGKFPDSNTPPAQLSSFYAQHHARVAAGGLVQAWAAILLAVFAAALYVQLRERGTHPVAGVVALIGAGVAVVGTLGDGTAYWLLGHIGNERGIGAGALQAWHILGSEGTLVTGGGTAVLLLGVAAAGVLPRWLTWPAVVIGLLQLTPVGFLASLLFLAWIAAAGVLMATGGGVAARRRLDPATV
jgi:hypothetical protein